jgi:hypothetical protein
MKPNMPRSASDPYPRKLEGTRRRIIPPPESAARQSKMKVRQQRSPWSPRMPAMSLGPDSRTVAETEVPIPGALNPLATAIDSETPKESGQLVTSDPSIAQHHVEVTIITLGPKADDGVTDWLDLFLPERDYVSSISTSDLVASPQPSPRSERDTLQPTHPGPPVFVPLPSAAPFASPRRAARFNERSFDTIVAQAERLMRYGRRPIRVAVQSVARATRAAIDVTRLALERLAEATRLRLTRGSQTIVAQAERLMRYGRRPIRVAVQSVAKATRAVIDVTRLALERLTEAMRLRLTRGSQVSRRAHRVATACAIAMALAATLIYVLPPSVSSTPAGNRPRAYQRTAMSNGDLAFGLKLAPSPPIPRAAALLPARDLTSNLSIGAGEWGIGTRGNALRRVRLASTASGEVKKSARSGVRLAATSGLVAHRSGPLFKGALVITSVPDGAEVSINGVFHGRTPLVIQSLPAGNRVVRLDLPGYDRWSWSVGVVANKRTSVSVTLRSETGPFVAKTGSATVLAHDREHIP